MGLAGDFKIGDKVSNLITLQGLNIGESGTVTGPGKTNGQIRVDWEVAGTWDMLPHALKRIVSAKLRPDPQTGDASRANVAASRSPSLRKRRGDRKVNEGVVNSLNAAQAAQMLREAGRRERKRNKPHDSIHDYGRGSTSRRHGSNHKSATSREAQRLSAGTMNFHHPQYYPQLQVAQPYACVERLHPTYFTKKKADQLRGVDDLVMAVDPMTHRMIRFKKVARNLYAPDGVQYTDTVIQVRFMIINSNMDIECYYAKELRDGWKKATDQNNATCYWKGTRTRSIRPANGTSSHEILKQYNYTNDSMTDGPELKVDSKGNVTLLRSKNV